MSTNRLWVGIFFGFFLALSLTFSNTVLATNPKSKKDQPKSVRKSSKPSDRKAEDAKRKRAHEEQRKRDEQAKRKKAEDEKRQREAKQRERQKKEAEEKRKADEARKKRDAESKRLGELRDRVKYILPHYFWGLIDERQIARIESIQRKYDSDVKAAKYEQAKLAEKFSALEDRLKSLRERLPKDKDSVLNGAQRKQVEKKRAESEKRRKIYDIQRAAARKKAEATKKRAGNKKGK